MASDYTTDLEEDGSQNLAGHVCTPLDDLAFIGRLAVGGQYCSLPADAPTVYVNGDLHVEGAAVTQSL